jgi:hypothetical protein
MEPEAGTRTGFVKSPKPNDAAPLSMGQVTRALNESAPRYLGTTGAFALPIAHHGIEPHLVSPDLCQRAGVEPAFPKRATGATRNPLSHFRYAVMGPSLAASLALKKDGASQLRRPRSAHSLHTDALLSFFHGAPSFFKAPVFPECHESGRC